MSRLLITLGYALTLTAGIIAIAQGTANPSIGAPLYLFGLLSVTAFAFAAFDNWA